ncbi:replication factor A protein 3 [Mortierella sp. GBAus27b]|nr:hypothetical protein BGX31_009085 [Mortierella sp. GBA43]KAI8345134.1 replication factor A protein 3 [Mortierella sp. GBAus27b]
MSMTYPTTPRVNSAMLSKFVGQDVRFVGKIHKQDATRGQLIASDKGNIEVHRSPDSRWGTHFVEIIGMVNEDETISERASINFGNDFDLDTYNELVMKMQQFPSVF